MSSLPAPIVEALERAGAGAVLEAVASNRVVRFPSLDSTPRSSPLWAVRTEREIWLVSAVAPSVPNLRHRMVAAAGQPGEAILDTRFGRTDLKVMGVRAPFAQSAAPSVQALYERWRTSTHLDGASVPWTPGLSESPEATTQAPIEGALLPSEFPPTAAWLWGFDLDAKVSLPGFVRDTEHRLGLGLTEEGLSWVAFGTSGAPVRSPALRIDAGGSIFGQGVRLRGGWFDHGRLETLAQLSAMSVQQRWQWAIESSLSLQRSEASAQLIRAGISRGMAPPALMVGLALRLQRGDLAEAWMAQMEKPTFSDLEHRSQLVSCIDAESAAELMESVPSTNRPDPTDAPHPGIPWPPRDLPELWATYSFRRGAASLERLEATERGLSFKAAFLESSSSLLAARAWLAQAEAAVEAEGRPGPSARRAAELFTRSKRGTEAHQAIETFLREDPFDGASFRELAELNQADRGPWLGSIADLLEGFEVKSAFDPLTSLDKASVAALSDKVEDRGWLSSLRKQLYPSLPSRDQLIRGLERIETPSDLATLVADLSTALELDPVPTYVFRGDDALGVAAWPTSPPVLLIGAEHLEPSSPRYLKPGPLRYAIAVELAHLAAAHPILSVDQSLVGTSRSVYQAFGRFAGTAETAVDLVSLIPGIDQLSKIQKILKLSRKVFVVRKSMDKAGSLAQPLFRRYLPTQSSARGLVRDGLVGTGLRLRRHADRIALRLTADLASATRAILLTGPSPVGRVQRFEERGLERLVVEDEQLNLEEAVRLSGLLSDCLDWTPEPRKSGA